MGVMIRQEGFFRVLDLGDKRGELTDPYNGNTVSFSNQDEFLEALNQLNESRQEYLRQRLKAELLLASSGDPQRIESIYRATQPDKLKNQTLYDEHTGEMENAVTDAVRASASQLTLDELKKYASIYPGLDAILNERLFKIKKVRDHQLSLV